MNKYILELLKLESTVIIPNFGALMKTGGTLLFNSILKYNDGKLEKFISEKEGADVQTVSNLLAKHVEDMIIAIDKGEDYVVFGLGKFLKSEDKIIFIPEENITSEQQSIVVLDIEKSEIKESIIKEIKTEEIVDKNQDSDVVKTDISKQTEESIIKGVTKEEIEEVQIKKAPVAKPAGTTNKVAPVIPVKNIIEKPKKKKRWILPLILFLLLACGGTFVGLQWQKVKVWVSSISGDASKAVTDNIESNKEINSLIESETGKEDVVIIEDEDEIIDEEINEEENLLIENNEDSDVNDNEINEEDLEVEKEEIVEEIEEKIITEVDESLTYHIIIGAFGSKKNANNLVDKLKESGFNNARILRVRNGLSHVAAGSYSSKNEAKLELDKAKEFNEAAFIQKK